MSAPEILYLFFGAIKVYSLAVVLTINNAKCLVESQLVPAPAVALGVSGWEQMLPALASTIYSAGG